MTTARLGFIGLGLMGSAIASRLLTRHPLTVWNRTPAASVPLAEAGAAVAGSADEVFATSSTVFVMVSDERAIDDLLGTVGPQLSDTTLVQMSTVPPSFSETLALRIADAGGRYVEAPVSGSRQPALDGRLIGSTRSARPSSAAVRRRRRCA
jgi:3-hydroxyisobutyrate dehydrogenase